MPDKIRVFLDTSALFAGIWSSAGGGRMLLKLGEAGAIQLLVSPQVITEIEGVLRRKAPEMLGLMAIVLDQSDVEVVAAPPPEAMQEHLVSVGHLGDAQIWAAVGLVQPDYFVTLDRKHFLDNPALRSSVAFPVGTPGDFLIWYRAQLSAKM